MHTRPLILRKRRTSQPETNPVAGKAKSKHAVFVLHDRINKNRFCTYPQSIVIKLLSGKCRIYKLQLVMHHYKIPTTALFYIGRRNKDGSEVIFSRIGFVFYAPWSPFLLTIFSFVEFSDNKSTGFKTRELKTVDLDVEGEYLKMELEKCHVNKMNLYNQVKIFLKNEFKSCVCILGCHYCFKCLGQSIEIRFVDRRILRAIQ